MRILDGTGRLCVSYPYRQLREALDRKFEHLVLINADRVTMPNGATGYDYTGATYHLGIDVDAWESLLRNGQCIVDIRMGRKDDGGVRSHGTAFRLSEQLIGEMYAESVDLLDTSVNLDEYPLPQRTLDTGVDHTTASVQKRLRAFKDGGGVQTGFGTDWT